MPTRNGSTEVRISAFDLFTPARPAKVAQTGQFEELGPVRAQAGA
jgi:hypothetical protein